MAVQDRSRQPSASRRAPLRTHRLTSPLLSLLAFTLLLASCASQTAVPVYHTGSDGLTMEFLPGMPPEQVYEGLAVPLAVRLWNRGASDLNYSEILFSVKGDAFYVAIVQDTILGESLEERSREEAWPDRQEYDYPEEYTLHGKRLGYPDGDYIDVRPQATFTYVQGPRESPVAELFASLCYPYDTYLATSLCVDANAFNGNVQKQVCSAQTLSFQDQGAPVAITSVENRPTPSRVLEEGGRGFLDIVKPVFVIRIKNVGGGTVISPPVAREGQERACALDVPDRLLNAVAIDASLSGLNLTCDPDPVPLIKDEGFTTCTLVAAEGNELSAPNYLAVFTARLSYLYRETLSTEVEILRRPGNLPEDYYLGQLENPSLIAGQPRCDYCSQHPSDPRCDDWPDGFAEGSYTCACSERACREKADPEHGEERSCIYGQSWCPGTSYCCIP